MPRHPLLPLLRAGVVLLVGVALLYRPRRPVPPVPEVPAVWATDGDVWGGALQLGEKATKALPGQKKPPCAPRREREVAGACWVPHLERPPCPEGTYEGVSRGEALCLLPIRAERPATSIGH